MRRSPLLRSLEWYLVAFAVEAQVKLFGDRLTRIVNISTRAESSRERPGAHARISRPEVGGRSAEDAEVMRHPFS